MPNCDHCHGDFTDDKHFLSCKDCPLISHVKCARYAKKNCKPTAADDDDATSSGGESLPTTKNNNNNNNNKSNNSNNNASGNASGGAGGGSSSSGTMERTVEMLDGHIGKMSLDDTSVYSSGGGAGSGSENGHDSDSVASSSGKPGENPSKKFRQNPNKKSTQMLQRISQKIRKTNGVFWSGHMVYYKKDKSQVSHSSRIFSFLLFPSLIPPNSYIHIICRCFVLFSSATYSLLAPGCQEHMHLRVLSARASHPGDPAE